MKRGQYPFSGPREDVICRRSLGLVRACLRCPCGFPHPQQINKQASQTSKYNHNHNHTETPGFVPSLSPKNIFLGLWIPAQKWQLWLVNSLFSWVVLSGSHPLPPSQLPGSGARRRAGSLRTPQIAHEGPGCLHTGYVSKWMARFFLGAVVSSGFQRKPTGQQLVILFGGGRWGFWFSRGHQKENRVPFWRGSLKTSIRIVLSEGTCFCFVVLRDIIRKYKEAHLLGGGPLSKKRDHFFDQSCLRGELGETRAERQVSHDQNRANWRVVGDNSSHIPYKHRQHCKRWYPYSNLSTGGPSRCWLILTQKRVVKLSARLPLTVSCSPTRKKNSPRAPKRQVSGKTGAILRIPQRAPGFRFNTHVKARS